MNVWVIVLIIIAVVAIGIGLYFWIRDDTSSDTSGTAETFTTTQLATNEINTTGSEEIVIPTCENSNYIGTDLYPTDSGQEFRPANSMYTHLENNFLDVGPQIGVGTRVNSHRNGPQLIFRRQFAVPTVPTGYWNQSTISQPIFTNNVC